ncbi:MAG TPA: M20 family metallopeptidase [Halanaerobiales bacterium]|nr:M20 family metallopeptidase [Halanaerobiales bacterium]
MANKDTILNNLEEIKDDLINLNDRIGKNPELGFKEFKAVKWLTDYLASHNFKIKKPIGGLETAFKAEYDFNEPGPVIAYLCEYDALPNIGHGCGHNMIGVMSVGAAVALSKYNDLKGTIQVIGCPGEEVGGGKVTLVEKGIFDEVDAAMMVHPSNENRTYSTSLAIEAIKFTFHGQTAHAAAAPEKGINALDGVIQLFNGINAIREHLKDDVRIHGIISKGGESPNVVPDLAEAKFYFRARQKDYLKEVIEKGKNIARGAAQMTGCEVEFSNFENSNDNLNPSGKLAATYEKNLKLAGVNNIADPEESLGSTDMGNVSQVVPSIHPYIKIGDELIGHTVEFRDATMSKKGQQALIKAAQALALTGYDILNDNELLEEIVEEFQSL